MRLINLTSGRETASDFRFLRLQGPAFLLATCMAIAVVERAQASHGVAAASFQVQQIDDGNTTNSIRISVPLTINSLQVEDNSDRADLFVRVGSDAEDDEQQGVMISSVAENGRNNAGSTEYPISTVHALNSYRICTSVPTAQTAGQAAEFNVNVSAAWFSYSNFVGGVARNSSGLPGQTNDVFTSSPGLVLGTHFRQVNTGVFAVDLRSLGINSTDGVLLVNGAADDNNFALSRANADGTWTIFVRDNAEPNMALFEQGPVAFVFVPRTNTAVVCGKFNGDASIALHSGDSPAFTVNNLGTGRWDLRIDGYTPDDGVLIISAEGGGPKNADNIVSYAPNSDGSGWEIQSRDTPGNELETPAGTSGLPVAVASFVFVPALRAQLLFPAPGAMNVGPSPRLEFAVSNAVDDVTVTVYARERPAPPSGPDFMIVALPDTQFYAAEINGGKKEMFIAQTEWVVTNRMDNIVYVAHLGDISQSGDIKSGLPNAVEWSNAGAAMYRLEDNSLTQMIDGMPYGLAVGNHDNADGTTTFYNQYFGVSHFLGRSYFGGHYGNNNNNHYDLFSAGGLDFIVIYFEYDTTPDTDILAWANALLQSAPHRRAIVVTHYMGTAKTPSTHSVQGAAIYNALKGNPNLFLLLGGHVGPEGSRVDTYNGNDVWTLISDYQGYAGGGNGFMRLMTFSPSNNVVTIQTYSPWLDKYETDANSEFFFTYDMQPPEGGIVFPGGPWEMLATITVKPGEVMSAAWRGLTMTKTYEWYATATDKDGNTAAIAPQHFTTGQNLAPYSSNSTVRVTGDQPSELHLIGTDPNQDALSFRNYSFPRNGIISDFDTNQGVLTYVPIRGFRGGDGFAFSASDGQLESLISNFYILVDPPADTNANGLPDAWETMYGVNDPEDDADGDGQSNKAEYKANTNPTNAASVLRISCADRQPDGSVVLNWQATGGTRYRVLCSDAKETGFTGIFTELARDLVIEMDPGPYGMPSTQAYTDSSAATNTSGRFYKIKVVP